MFTATIRAVLEFILKECYGNHTSEDAAADEQIQQACYPPP